MPVKTVTALRLGLLMMVLLAVGCSWKGQAARQSEGAETASTIWRPTPVRMRVYPATRFARGDGYVLLEARIEMVDAMDDPTKAAGRFRFELLDAEREDAGSIDQLLYSWDVPLLTLAHQRQHYDSVTRTYLFRLRMDEQLAPRETTTLLVKYMPPTGSPLSAEYELAGAP